MTCPKLFLFTAVLVFAIAAKESALGEPVSEPRQTFDTSFYIYTDERSDVPVLIYRQRLGHHLQWIADSPIRKILIWRDGTIDWEVDWGALPRARRFDCRWYRVTASAEKVEAALQEIAESFAQYPVEYRSRDTSIIFYLGANNSPRINVYDSRHYVRLGMDDFLWLFYQEFREVFRSGDNAAIVEMMRKELGRSLDRLVEYYRRTRPQAGLSEPRTPVYSDEEILKVTALFAADAEHLLLVEKKVFDLLWSTWGLGMKRIDVNFRDTDFRDVHVEREIRDGKSEFFYSLISREEAEEIRARLRAEREAE